MKFEAFKTKYKHYPVVKSIYFALEDNPAYIRRLVSEWCEKGWLLSLRRGMYLINDEDILEKTEKFSVANHIYEPSYVSLESALGFYGLIPEGTNQVTSVSTRKTIQFRNELGQFRFSHLQESLFWGYVRESLGKSSIIISSPEKALFDLLYLRKGEFKTADEVVESLRLQNLHVFKKNKLLEVARGFKDRRFIVIGEALSKALPRGKN